VDVKLVVQLFDFWDGNILNAITIENILAHFQQISIFNSMIKMSLKTLFEIDFNKKQIVIECTFLDDLAFEQAVTQPLIH